MDAVKDRIMGHMVNIPTKKMNSGFIVYKNKKMHSFTGFSVDKSRVMVVDGAVPYITTPPGPFVPCDEYTGEAEHQLNQWVGFPNIGTGIFSVIYGYDIWSNEKTESEKIADLEKIGRTNFRILVVAVLQMLAEAAMYRGEHSRDFDDDNTSSLMGYYIRSRFDWYRLPFTNQANGRLIDELCDMATHCIAQYGNDTCEKNEFDGLWGILMSAKLRS
jgi:hypothetical protein